MLDNILDTLVRLARRCERSARPFNAEPLSSTVKRIIAAVETVDDAWGQCFIGRHSLVYIADLLPRQRGEWYSNFRSRGHRWVEYDPKTVEREILLRADVTDTGLLEEAAQAGRETFEQAKREMLPCFDALLATADDAVVRDLKGQATALPSHVPQADFAGVLLPSGSYAFTWDDRAAGAQFQVPPHLAFKAWVLSRGSYKDQLQKLAHIARHAVQYLQLKRQLEGNTVAKKSGKIFIGHGRSFIWRDLKDFLQDRLGLEWDEFNREATAGLSTKERLETMLDEAVFAFLVMTAEDQQADGSLHARENVIHEAGLFQGRLGFERAILLLEEGCSEFGNIVGLTQIRFPKGNIRAQFEEIRRVLEREEIIKH